VQVSSARSDLGNAASVKRTCDAANDGQLAQPATSRAVSLRLDALDPDDAEAGVFTANLSHIAPLFVLECLDRVHVREL
jgi:hypothetical protein